jgi:hypothetical protein
MRQTERVQLLIGTDDGLYYLTDGTPRRLRDGKVTHLAAGSIGAWMIANERLTEPSPENLALPEGLQPRCLLGTQEALLIGTSEAHMYRARRHRRRSGRAVAVPVSIPTVTLRAGPT